MKDASEVMPEATSEVYNRLKNEPLLAPFVLIGGTALALHLGHRKSEDLDFITTRQKLPRHALDLLTGKLQSDGFSVANNDDPATYDEFMEAGLSLGDYERNLVINGAVKITFFTSDPETTRLLGSAECAQNSAPRVATLQELSALKALIASKRSNSRDWLDLYILAREHGFTFNEWKRAYHKAGLSNGAFDVALNRICSGKLAGNDPGFASLLPSAPSLNEITTFFTRMRRDYEQEAARIALRQDAE